MRTVELLLVIVGLAISTVFLGLAGLTLYFSIREWYRDKKRVEARNRVRNEMLERAYREFPLWKSWVAGLSTIERAELESVLQRYLRTVKGGQKTTFIGLADAMKLGPQADATLDEGSVPEKLQALSTLALIDYEIPKERLFETCQDNRRTREAGARLMFERKAAYDSPERWGTELLLSDPDEELTVYGMEVLFNLNDGVGTPVLNHAQMHSTTWNTALLVQVCRVLEHCQITERDPSFDWVLPLLEHDDSVVRDHAVRVFTRHGWRDSLRTRIPYRQLIADESPAVRRAIYEVLTYWGGTEAKQLLEWVVIDETDSRCQLVAIRGLLSLGADSSVEHPAWPEVAWNWIEAELAIDRGQRLPSQELVGGQR